MAEALPVPVENNGKTTANGLGGVTGRGFLPGHSGNPGGRPKALSTLICEQTNDGAELVAFMLAVLRGKRKASLGQRMEAAAWLADRGFGKVALPLEHSGTEGGPVEFVFRYVNDWRGQAGREEPR